MKTLRLKNFRCLEDTGDIEIKPLTFLVGANSSGKSSFLKFFPLLRQSVRVRKKGVLLWNYHDVDLRDFRNTLREGAEDIIVDFMIGLLPLKGRSRNASAGIVAEDVHVTLVIAASGDHYDYLSQIVIKYDDQSIKIDIDNDNKTKIIVNGKCMTDAYPMESILLGQGTGIIPGLWFETENDIFSSPNYNFSVMRKLVQEHFSSTQMAAARVRGALDLILFSKNELKEYTKTEWGVVLRDEDIEQLNDLLLYQNVASILYSLNDCVTDFANSVEYIRPLRATVERYYRFQNYAIDEIDSNGENLAMYLYNLMPSQKKRLDDWTMRMFGFKILVNAHEGHVELGVSEGDSQIFHNLVDVGFGYTQLLPILVLIWKAVYTGPGRLLPRKNTKKVIVIEQPELHLHPKMQMLFADMLVRILQTTEKGKFRFVIETHSETIINRIGEKISSESNFTRDDVNVVLFQKGERGSSVSIANYDKDGYLDNWPVGFFSGYAD